MNHSDFQNIKLEKVVTGIYSDEGKTSAQLEQELVARGYNPSELASSIQARIAALSAKRRLSWMEAATENQSRLDEVLPKVSSWLNRSIEEIEHAFNSIISGNTGENAQARQRLLTAFRNVKDLPIQSKAHFLDEVEALKALEDKAKEKK